MGKKGSSSLKISKKQVQETVYNKLALALAEYKGSMKEKRFASNLKKASKLFADDISRKAVKENPSVEKKGKSSKGDPQTVEVA